MRRREYTHDRCMLVTGYNSMSSRIITARFDAAQFKLTVIHVYAPRSFSSD